MPIKLDDIFYELAVKDADFAAALKTAARNLELVDQSARKGGQGLGSLENGIRALRGSLTKIAGGAALGFAAKAFIANSIEAQRALAQLQAAVRSTGAAAGYTVPQLVKLSEEISHLSTFSTEAVQGGLSRLLTYTGIQGPMFKEAARATVDFATALNIDVTSAAERVGNALQYPSEAINSLSKQGFRFTAEQKRLIEGYESTGQLAKAQAIILKELDEAYRGSATAARDTLGGALAALRNDFKKAFEVGRDSSGGMIEAINLIAKGITTFMPYLRRFINEVFIQMDLVFIGASVR